MLKLHQVTATPEWWKRLEQFSDRLTFQTEGWIRFIAETQHATPVFAEVRDGSSFVGCFHSLLIQRFGLKILASPFPGWTTDYMGFNLQPEVPRWLALQAVEHFAFHDLSCVYFEVTDRLFTPEDGKRFGLEPRVSSSYETDLTRSEEELFAGMAGSCRQCIRKAQHCGVVIEEAAADDAFVQEYYDQLTEIFLKQGLLPTYSLRTVRNLLHYLYPAGHLALFRARNQEGKCIATGIYHGVNKFASLWGNASLRDYLPLRPNQALHWHALRYWRGRGAECFDWGGGGDYKAKYGSRKVNVLRFSKSRIPLLSKLRDQAQRAYLQQLRWRAWWKLAVRKDTVPLSKEVLHDTVYVC
jgi:hypothetical protein